MHEQFHDEPHPKAGQMVTISPLGGREHQLLVEGVEARVEDWWDRLYQKSWRDSNGIIAAANYGHRMGRVLGPLDDEVVYVKIKQPDSSLSLGYLVHQSEIIEQKEEEDE